MCVCCSAEYNLFCAFGVVQNAIQYLFLLLLTVQEGCHVCGNNGEERVRGEMNTGWGGESK